MISLLLTAAAIAALAAVALRLHTTRRHPPAPVVELARTGSRVQALLNTSRGQAVPATATAAADPRPAAQHANASPAPAVAPAAAPDPAPARHSPYAANILTADAKITLPDDDTEDPGITWRSTESPSARPIAEAGAIAHAVQVADDHGRIHLADADEETIHWSQDPE